MSGLANEHSEVKTFLRSQPKFVRELLAGGIAGGIAKTCVAPLERTKILFQTGKSHHLGVPGTLAHLWKHEGWHGLFRGNAASVLRIVPYAAIHFGVYEHYRRIIIDEVLAGQTQVASSQGTDSSSSSSSSTARPSHHVSSPVTPLRSRSLGEDGVLQVSASGSSIDITAAGTAARAASTSSIHQHATSHRASDLPSQHQHEQATSTSTPGQPSASLSQTTSSTSIDSASTSTNTSSHNSSNPPMVQLHPGWDLLAGSLAGATAVITTYPLDLIRTRMAYSADGVQGLAKQAAPSSSSSPSSLPASSSSGAAAQRAHHYPTIRSVMVETWTKEGVKGMYKGVSPTLLGILPYAGLKFYVYQSMKNWYKVTHQDHPSPQQAPQHSSSGAASSRSSHLPIHIMLLYGGLAGLVAQTVTYPLDVVRRRMQVEGLPGAPAPATATALAATAAATAAKHVPGVTVLGAARVAATLATATAAVTAATATAAASVGGSTAARGTTWLTFRRIIAEEGAKGLFRGLSINYLKVVPSTAIGFTVYDFLKSYLGVQGSL